MGRSPIGHYEESVVAGEKIRAFVPDPLPPKEEILFDAKRQQLLERATMALGRLDSITLKKVPGDNNNIDIVGSIDYH